MRIDNNSSIVDIASRRAAGAGSNSRAAGKSASNSGAVVVDLGAAAARSQESNGLPDDIAKRLAEVSAQLADGSYDFDFGVLADRIADEEIARSGG